MKKITYLLTVLILQACSSIHDISYEERDRGSYLFSKKLKAEYTKFFTDEIFKDGTYVYAGPSFFKFNNFQMIKLQQLELLWTGNTIYTEKDGSRHEYNSFIPLSPYYGDGAEENSRKFFINFSAVFKSFQQTAVEKLVLIGTIRCKKDIKCHLIPDIDFALFNDPYDFSLKLEDEDMIITENVALSNFSDYDATLIANRMIYVGMDQKAAELAVGKTSYSQGASYKEIIFKNGKVESFKFGNYNYDLHYFTHH